jgi:hypothetical protein
VPLYEDKLAVVATLDKNDRCQAQTVLQSFLNRFDVRSRILKYLLSRDACDEIHNLSGATREPYPIGLIRELQEA